MEEKDKIWPPPPLVQPPDSGEQNKTLSPAVVLPLGFLAGSVCQALVWWLVCYVALAPLQSKLTLLSWRYLVSFGTALLSMALCAGMRRRWRAFGNGFSAAMSIMFCIMLWMLWASPR